MSVFLNNMENDFYGLKNLSLRFRYLPRWIIIAIDLIIVYLSILVTHFLLMGLKGNDSNVISGVPLLFLLTVYFFSFLLFKTYSGILRHSSYLDALKLLVSTTCSLLVLIAVNYFLRQTAIGGFFLTTELIINAFFSFSILFSLRLFVKQLFAFFKDNFENSLEINEKVLILGFNENSVAIGSAIENELPRRFNLAFFVSMKKEKKVANLRALGKPIKYIDSIDSLKDKIVEFEITGIILSDSKISSAKLFEIVDFAAKKNVKVYKAPLVSDTNSNFITKKIESIKIEDLLDRKPIELDQENKIKEFKNKKILVTGGAGSIGAEIVRQLAKYEPSKLIVVDQAETPSHNLQIEIENSFKTLDFQCVIGDISNKSKLQDIFEKYDFDIVFHAAAYKHVPLMEENPTEAVFVNIMGTKNLADLSILFGVERFVMVSTDKAVNPSNVMGASKRVAEKYVQSLFFADESKTKFITTRFGNVLGSNGSVVPLFKKQIESGGPVTITHPDIIRFFMTIPEACQLVLEAGVMGKGGEIFIFDMGEPVKIMDLAKRMIRLYGYKPYKDIVIKITGLRQGEKLYEELLSDKSKTVPTHHNKIMIGVDKSDNFEVILESVNKIIDASFEYDNNKVVKRIKELVPEYISLNSEYEIHDINAEN